jgi:hypothetical protein
VFCVKHTVESSVVTFQKLKVAMSGRFDKHVSSTLIRAASNFKTFRQSLRNCLQPETQEENSSKSMLLKDGALTYSVGP